MEIIKLTTDQLKTSDLNMRALPKKSDLSDILPSIRQHGVIQNLIVRKNGTGFHVIAGGRRFAAALEIAQETNSALELPCALVEGTDDAAALELSMIENMARLDPNPVEQYRAFAILKEKGQSIDEISMVFGISVLGVKQRLALGNLQPAILQLYQDKKLDGNSLQLLTLADKKKQTEWLKLFKSKEWHPTGHLIKNWIFNEGNISADNAIFDLELYTGSVVSDLFNEETILSDTAQFWELQNLEIAARKAKYIKNGWAGVELVEGYFQTYDHEPTTKKEGGKVFIRVRQDGKIEFHEGYLTEREVKASQAAENGETVSPSLSRPEISNPAQEYFALHRHAAVRNELPKNPMVGFRMMVAQSMSSMRRHITTTGKDEIAESVKNSKSVTDFNAKSVIALERLGISTKKDATHFLSTRYSTLELFQILIHMTDKQVMEVCAYISAELLTDGSMEVDVLGQMFDVDMSKVWEADDTFLNLIRDKSTLNAVVASVGGQTLADANISATGKIMRGILKDLFAGEGGRKKVSGWIPEWFKFPFSFHTKTEGLSELRNKKTMKSYMKSLAKR